MILWEVVSVPGLQDNSLTTLDTIILYCIILRVICGVCLYYLVLEGYFTSGKMKGDVRKSHHEKEGEQKYA